VQTFEVLLRSESSDDGSPAVTHILNGGKFVN